MKRFSDVAEVVVSEPENASLIAYWSILLIPYKT